MKPSLTRAGRWSPTLQIKGTRNLRHQLTESIPVIKSLKFLVERDRSAISEIEIENMASASSSASSSASASGSKLRADAKPYVRGSNIGLSSEVPLPATLCTLPVCDGTRMPAPVFKPFPDSPIEDVAPGGYTPVLLPPGDWFGPNLSLFFIYLIFYTNIVAKQINFEYHFDLTFKWWFSIQNRIY